MNPTPSMPPPAGRAPSRVRPLLCWLALAALAAGVVHLSKRAWVEAEGRPSAPVSVARSQLENRDGRLHRQGAADAFSGWMTDPFPSGTVRLRSAVLDGQLHGESTAWFTNGVVELREQFQRGLSHGPRLTWHASGQKRSEGFLEAGQQQGVYRQWHENGKLAVEAGFAAGKPHGLSRAWHPDGSLKAEALLNHGEVQVRHVYPDGTRWEPTLMAATPTP